MATVEACCTPGFTWEGTPAGKVVTIAGVPAYASASYEHSAAPVVLLISGVRAVAPDILGDTALKRGDFPHGVPKFLEQNPFPQKAVQVEAIVEACSSSKVGLLGFCWGAKPCVMAAAKTGTKLAAVAVNHPSMLTQEDVEAIAVPVWMNFSGPTDPMVNPEQRASYEQVLSSKPGSGSKHLSNMQHGWTLKGNEKDAQVQQGASKALENNIRFFKQHLA